MTSNKDMIEFLAKKLISATDILNTISLELNSISGDLSTLRNMDALEVLQTSQEKPQEINIKLIGGEDYFLKIPNRYDLYWTASRLWEKPFVFTNSHTDIENFKTGLCLTSNGATKLRKEFVDGVCNED